MPEPFCLREPGPQLDYINREWLMYYNNERPPQGKEIGNKVLRLDFAPMPNGEIKREQRPGGIISWYYREAKSPQSTRCRVSSTLILRVLSFSHLAQGCFILQVFSEGGWLHSRCLFELIGEML